MRTINKLLGIAFTAILLLMVKPTATQAQPGVTVSYQTFYDELQPYGTWVDDPDYGDVWVPDVEDGFKPYATRGHWVVTEYGNTWVSDYDWGWAPFHYGRWRFDDYYGWEWIPGSEWGPAWVNWRTGGDYYAWAPLGPRVSIDISFGSGYSVPDDYWVCAPRAYINSPRIYDYYVPRNRVVTIIRNTTIINNVYVNNNRRFVAGPRNQDIERYTGRPVRVYGLNNSNRPGTTVIENNTVNVYRPTIIRNNNGNGRPRPTRVVDASAYRNQHPNEGIANRDNGATIRHENATRLAQIARNPQAENTGVVRVNRPGINSQPNGNGGNNNGGFNRNNTNPDNGNNNGGRPWRNNGSQPNQQNGSPANNTNPVIPNGNGGNNGGFNRNNGNRNQPTDPANNTPANPSRNTRPENQPAVNPAVVPNNGKPTTTPVDNNRFNRGRSRQGTANPNAGQAPAVQPQQQNPDQAAKQAADQQAAQQRQQQMQQSQQRQIQDEQRRQQMQQMRQQQEQARQQRQPQPQNQPQQQPQNQPQQRPQNQPQQRPQVQPQQQRPQPQPQQQRPQRQEERRKDEKPPM